MTYKSKPVSRAVEPDLVYKRVVALLPVFSSDESLYIALKLDVVIEMGQGSLDVTKTTKRALRNYRVAATWRCHCDNVDFFGGHMNLYGLIYVVTK